MNAVAKIEAASLHSAMALAFGEIEAATKAAAGQVGQQRYKYADIGAVIDAIKPALVMGVIASGALADARNYDRERG